MTDWITLINFSIAAAGFLLALLGLTLALINRTMEQWSKRFFTQLFSLLILYVGSNLTGQILIRYPNAVRADKIMLFLESLFSSLLLPLLLCYMLHVCGEDIKKSLPMRAAAVLWLLYFALLCITQFTTQIYYFTPDHVYHRGPWYPVLLITPAMTIFLSLMALIRRRKKLSARQFIAFLIYLATPLLAILFQMFFYGIYAIVLGTVLSSVFLFLFILSDQMERFAQTAEENARQRASIMVLQMRPHFIYNTMMSIYYLCRQDPEKAQQVTLDFSSYLRRNFTAIVREESIPFSEELEHTRAYLAVEQVRFGGSLFVAFDTPCTQFRLPPLTLQPIVENAVKHGVDPELSPLHIAVSTREEKKRILITVEDDGPGFGAADNDEPHVALNNIRERLRMMRGELKISQRPGGGTRVTVIVPRAQAGA